MEFLRRRWLIILVAAIFLGILVFIVLPWGYRSYVKSQQAQSARQRNPQINLDKLYDDALKDMEEEKYDDAVGKLEALVNIAPDYKEAKAKLQEAKKLRKDTPSEMPPSERSADDKGGENSPPPRTSPEEIDADATPLSLLPEKLDGFKTVERKWESPPIEAFGRYDPIDKDVKDKIEMVWIVVAKWKSKPEAENRFNYQRELFPDSPQSLGVNGHSASFSLTQESRPDIFPAMASLSWNRINWFFAIEVVPLSTPSTEYKKATAMEVATKFGY